MSRPKVRLKSIGQIVVPAALALLCYVALPIVTNALDERIAAAEVKRLERVKLYQAGLEPCPEETHQIADERLNLRGDEVVAAVFPSFSEPYGVVVSAEGLRSFDGYPGLNAFPPPPPPPDSAAETLPSDEEVEPLEIFPLFPIHPYFGREITQLLKREIDQADAEPAYGLDGTTYLFKSAEKCATVWTPQAETRAYKLVDLVDELIALSRRSSSSTKVRVRIRELMIELERDRALLNG